MSLSYFVDTGQDSRIIDNIIKSVESSDVSDSKKDKMMEDLNKSMNKAGLVQKEVQVQGKNGKVYTRKQWMKSGEEVKANTSKQAVQKPEEKKRKQLPTTPYTITEKTKHLVPLKDGEPVPDYINNVKVVPPSWRNKMISPDPDAEILAMGKDDMDRTQYIYNPRVTEENKEEKFNRVMSIDTDKLEEVINGIEDKDTSDCLNLIYKMGLRPGSKRDTRSKVEATGATTLKGKHVVVDGDKVYLRFVGKKGVNQDHEVTDESLKSMLIERKNNVGDDDYLFNTSPTDLRNQLKPLDIKVKDLRTLLATNTAKQILSETAPVSDEKAFNKLVKDVCTQVSSVLGNKPTEAERSYINPSVFEEFAPELYKQYKNKKETKK